MNRKKPKTSPRAAGDSVVRLALTQMRCVPDPAKNRAAQLDLIEQAAAQGAQIVCAPELFASQYFCQTEDHRFFDLAEPIPGPTTDLLSGAARRHGTVIIGSIFERRAAGLYHNSAAVIDADGSILGIYRKMHIPDDPLYYEKFYFTPGDSGFNAFKTRYATIGVLICWDQWFPEAARLCALHGAQILFYPTAIGWHPREKVQYGAAQREAWEIVQRSHAVANGAYVCAANRVGLERIMDPAGRPVNADGIEFWGQSFIAGPDGQVIARASADQPEALVADVDLARVEFSRTHWPFLRDRRIDAYGDLLKRYVDGV